MRYNIIFFLILAGLPCLAYSQNVRLQVIVENQLRYNLETTGETALAALQNAGQRQDFLVRTTFYEEFDAYFLTRIGGYQAQGNLGWNFFINGQTTNLSVDQAELNNNDVIIFQLARPRTQDIALRDGWQLISLNTIPDGNWQDNRLSVPGILADLVNQGKIAIVKDNQGRFYSPRNNFSNIPGWNITEGYYVKISSDSRVNLTIEGGTPIPKTLPIQLTEGWNIIPYLARQPMEATEALASINVSLIIAKNARGQFWAPRYRFNNLDQFMPGFGYQVKVENDIILIYP